MPVTKKVLIILMMIFCFSLIFADEEKSPESLSDALSVGKERLLILI